ncbi:hypothetical protein NEIELOOT_01705 [Neisseria elongata subsp. glycolytica ATCC 29315]|uniref:Uncharacterized protein n=1 Tax=Neisseria elongata subsp. glycolytica ATCC 29315 TaxID=546263 RepID=D4DRL2_NEIEG|nr:hypothetical protein NEIELOOT_01705 [Neisseria elongata subsp. glycolytica ATCC 29315]
MPPKQRRIELYAHPKILSNKYCKKIWEIAYQHVFKILFF